MGNPAMMVDPWGLTDLSYEYAPGFVGPKSQPQPGDTRGSGSSQQTFIEGSWARETVTRPVTVTANDAPASNNTPLITPNIPEVRYQWGTPLSMQDYDLGVIRGLPQGRYAPAPAWMTGTLQIAVGVGGLALAAGVEWGTLGLGTFLAAGLVVYSADQIATGITTINSGKVQPTLLHTGVSKGLTAAGVSPNVADRVATGTEIATGVILTAGTAALTVARITPSSVAATSTVAPSTGAVGKGAEVTGQIHHAVSRQVHKALEQHPILKGVYQARDPRFVTQAKDAASHRGYQTWHRNLDAEVSGWIRSNPTATPQQFEGYLRQRYSQPDLSNRFPNGL